MESTRKTLIKCMKKLVREKSFSSISVDAVCEMAHISRRTFYRYFTDKYALLEATYVECYFSKLNISEDEKFWVIFERLCEQIYEEQDFFRHAFDVKGQNGFWEEAKKILLPYFMRDYPVTPENYADVRFYADNDINLLFQLIDIWLNKKPVVTAKEFLIATRSSFTVHGRWVFEAATNRPISDYTMQQLEKNEW